MFMSYVFSSVSLNVTDAGKHLKDEAGYTSSKFYVDDDGKKVSSSKGKGKNKDGKAQNAKAKGKGKGESASSSAAPKKQKPQPKKYNIFSDFSITITVSIFILSQTLFFKTVLRFNFHDWNRFKTILFYL